MPGPESTAKTTTGPWAGLGQGLLALGLGLLATHASAQITTLDSLGEVGEFASTAIGSDGLALISYYDRTNGDLKVAHCSDFACTAATLWTLDSTGDVGTLTSITIGGDGLGLVSYQDPGSMAVKVAHCLDLPCSTAEVTTLGAGGAGSIATGSDGLGLVAWQASGAVVVTHCEDAACSTRTSTAYGPIIPNDTPMVEVGPDGLGLVVYQSDFSQLFSAIAALHCQDVSCTSATTSHPVTASSLPPFYVWLTWHHNLAIGGDGRGFFTYRENQVFPLGGDIPQGDVTDWITHCSNADCSQAQTAFIMGLFSDGSLAAGADGLGLWAAAQATAGSPLVVLRCQDPSCGSLAPSPPLDSNAGQTALAVGIDGFPLVTYHGGASDLKVAHCVTSNCGPVFLSVGDATVVEGDAGTTSAVFSVTLGSASGVPVTVDFSTADGTATSPADYAPAAGSVTFLPGVTTTSITVAVAGDALDEPDETFVVDLQNPSNALIADGQGVGTIGDDDAVPAASIGDGAVVEGSAGTADATLSVSLSSPSGFPVTLDWQTTVGSDGTATPGVDFVVASGSLLFAPGEVARTVTAAAIGDPLVEPDETFYILLSNPANATIADDLGRVTIVDDDAPSLSSNELLHGSAQRHDLQAQPGPVADRDYFRLGQEPHTSWEVMVDGASGGTPPLILERLAADNVTVLQAGTTLTGGSSVSLRWSNDAAFPVTNQHLSVRSGGCGTLCDASAVYRIRAYETTGRIERFNNSATQVTFLVLGNTAPAPLHATAWFWSATGALLASQPFTLAPQATTVFSTATIPALAATSGSVTLTHDGGYGDLRGKGAAVEPATGFTFDTPLTYRPR